MEPHKGPSEPPLREQSRRTSPRRWRALNRFAALMTMPRGIYAGLGSGALGVPEFRRYLTGMIVSNVGSWMQMIAQGWLILELTGSPFYLGLVGLVRAIPALSLTLIGGVLADRFDRRRLLLITQMSAAMTSLTLGVLDLTGLVQVWHVLAIAFISSVIMAVDNPTRHAIVPALVGRQNIASAVALNSAAWNGASIIGPSIAGILVGVAGTGAAFIINGLSFLAVFYAVLTMKPLEQRPRGTQTMLENLTTGVRFILNDRRIWGVMIVIAIPTFFGRPIIQLMPEFARTVLDTGPEGYGLLMAATGIGALIGALSVSKLSASSIGQGRLLFLSSGIFALSLIFFSSSPWLIPSLLILLVVGATPTILMGISNTLLQMSITEEVRGRVMSAYSLVPMSLMPLGSMALGSASAVIGVSLAFIIGAAIILVATVLAYRLMPELRKAR
jgi:MFS family permease